MPIMTGNMVEVLKKQGKVTRSNALARSRHQLGLMQNRVMYLLFSRIQRDDGELRVQQIPIADIRDKLRGRYGSFYDELREAVTDLVGQKLYVEKANGGWKVMSWLTSAEYVRAGERAEGFDFLEIKLHEDLVPHLLQLKEKYNSIPLDALLALASPNSQRLIDILWHDSFAGERRILEYDIEDLKIRMNLSGKYDRFRDFTRVLDRVQSEFLDKTPLRFTYEGFKTGRAWNRIRFEVWFEGFDLKAQTPADPDDPTEKKKLSLTRKLQEAGYTQDITATLEAHSLVEVEEVLTQARAAQRRSAHSGTPIRNLGGLIHTMLKAGVGKRIPPEKVLKDDFKSGDLASVIVTNFLDARAQYAGQVWKKLNETERTGVHDLLKTSLKGFLLQEVEKAQWQGLIYEKVRNDALERSKYLEYPGDLTDIVGFSQNHELVSELSDDQREQVLRSVVELNSVS